MDSKTLKKQALELSHHERAQLAHLLIDSLHPETDFETEESWARELKSRIRQYEEGKSSTKSWTKVKRNAQNLLDE